MIGTNSLYTKIDTIKFVLLIRCYVIREEDPNDTLGV